MSYHGVTNLCKSSSCEVFGIGPKLSTRWFDMAKRFSVIIERDAAGYYVASVPALRGCHTQARSLDELLLRVKEAIELCLEVEGKEIEPLDFVGVQQVSIAV
jgi:predicted RNase H-like HicB family nuclease